MLFLRLSDGFGQKILHRGYIF